MTYRSKAAALLLLCSALGASAQSQVVTLSEQRLERVGDVLERLVEEKDVAGVQALLWQRGKVVYYASEGYQDLESGIPMSDSSLFRIYSMTKPITSVAALMLYEEGKLRLDDPVSRFIPKFAGLEVYNEDAPGERMPAPREITIHDLLTHRAGLTYGFFSNTPVDSMYWAHRVWSRGTLAQFVERVATVPLLYEPGKQWHYSVATDVLGRVVEVASGESLDVFCHERIFGPLKMHDTAFSVPADKIHRLSSLYNPNQEGGLRAVDRGPSSEFADPVEFLSGGGGLVSTPMDYIRFAELLFRGGSLGEVQLLKPETVALMTQDHLHQGADSGWGFGLGVEVFVDPTLMNEPGNPGMFGWAGAANTFFFVDPRAELIGMIFTQLRPFNRDHFQLPFKKAIYSTLN